MKRTLLATLLSTLVLIGCGNKEIKVKTDPVTTQLKVTNNTDKPMAANCTWCVGVGNQTDTIQVGESYTIQSNTHSASGTVFTVYPQCPNGKYDPENGTFAMTYGYWNGASHITCDWDCNVSNPTEKHHFPGQDWVFDMAWENEGDPMNGHVTFTVKPL